MKKQKTLNWIKRIEEKKIYIEENIEPLIVTKIQPCMLSPYFNCSSYSNITTQKETYKRALNGERKKKVLQPQGQKSAAFLKTLVFQSFYSTAGIHKWGN